MASFDVVILGGGIIGLSLAWRLRQQKLDVCVIDAGAAAPPASAAAAGMLAPSFEEMAGPGGRALYRFSAASLKAWPDFAAELEAASGVDVDLRRDGILGVATDAAASARLRTQAEGLLALGADIEHLDADDIRRLEPGLSPRAIAGVFAAADAQVDPVRVVAALSAAFGAIGGAHLRGRRASALLASGARMIGARLDAGEEILAQSVVLASGVYAPQLVADAPVFPVKGEALALTFGGARPITRCIRAEGAYLCPKADGRLIVGATEAPGETSTDVSGARIERLRVRAIELAPSLAGAPEQARWSGLRPATPDGAPILGADEAGPEGLVYAVGHHRNGVLLAPATAAALARFLVDGEATEIAEFTRGRASLPGRRRG